MDLSKFESLPAVIIIGEMKDRRAVFGGNSFDPSYKYTEGQFRSLNMRLKRLMTSPEFRIQQVHNLESGEQVYTTIKELATRTVLFLIVLQDYNFNKDLIQNIETIASRGGVYTAKRFYTELLDFHSGILDVPEEQILGYEQALQVLSAKTVSRVNLDEIARILRDISESPKISGDLIFNQTMQLLNSIPPELNSDEYLDIGFMIAERYYENARFNHALSLFEKIAEHAIINERLALEISCRLRNAKIARETNLDPTKILEILSPIDDGSLQVASQEEREFYYSLQGYCYKLIGDQQLAEDLHMMCIMISEMDSFPSIYVAESHAFMAERAVESYQQDVAVREFLTAANIASANNFPQYAIHYSHLAAIEEIKWAEYLSAAAVVEHMNGDYSNSEFHSWQSLKRLVNAYIHSDQERRKEALLGKSYEIINRNQVTLTVNHEEYAAQTIQQIEQQIGFIVKGLMPSDQEQEVLKFILTKISAMLPLPPPVLMLIANDGRLITAGEVGSDKWDESVLINDDLFSGALSAIMAMLSEVISGDSPLRMLDAGQTQIMIEKSEVCIGALLVDRDLNIIRKALRETVIYMERAFPELEDWDGYSIDFTGIKEKVEEIFTKAMAMIRE